MSFGHSTTATNSISTQRSSAEKIRPAEHQTAMSRSDRSLRWQVFVLPPGMQSVSDRHGQAFQDRWFRVDTFEAWASLNPHLNWLDEIGILASPSIGQEASQATGAGDSDVTNATRRKLAASSRGQPAGGQRSTKTITDPRRLILEAAHDIRSPLATANQIVSMVTRRLRRREALSGDELGLLEVANLQLMQASNWAEGILLERNLEARRPVVLRNRFYPPQLQSLVKPLLESLASLRDIQLNWDGWDRSLPRLYTDANHLSRVIINLATNAIEASEPGRSVGISVKGQGQNCKRLTIDILDEGPGLSLEVLRELNQPEPRWCATDQQSYADDPQAVAVMAGQGVPTGLGLAASKSLMFGLGGTLRASSRSGGGTSMRISLPVDDPQSLISNWLLHMAAAMPARRSQQLRRVQIYAVRLRGHDFQLVNRELQQAAGEYDFIYRVSNDRWLWLTMVERLSGTNSMIQNFTTRMKKLNVGIGGECLIEKVFQSRVFSSSSLQQASDDENQLPVLLNRIASKTAQLVGGHIPRIDDLQEFGSLILSRPIAKPRVHRIVREDSAASLRSHLSEASRVSHGRQAEATQPVGGVQELTAALSEIAGDWHATQTRLDESIMRVDSPKVVRPTSKYVNSVGVGR